MTKRIISVMMAAFIIFITIYNEYTVTVNATEVVFGGELIDYLVAFIIGTGATYMGYETVEGWDSNTVRRELHAYCNTTEGSSALNKYAGFKVIEGGGGSDPEPPEDPEDPNDILDSKVAGLALSKELFDLASGFFGYVTDSTNGSELGVAINAASNQEITVISPFPEYMHFTSVTERIYDDFMDERFKSFYPEYDPANSYYVQNVSGPFYHIITVPEDLESVGIASLSLIQSDDFNDYFLIAYDSAGNKVQLSRYNTYIPNVNNHSKYDGDNLSVGGYISDLYVCGDMDIYMDRSQFRYHLYPDGTVVQVLDGQPDQEVIPHITTAEGYLTSVKPIVNMDISSLIDAIGKAIADAYPDEAPVLTQEAINQIYNNISNVYDDAVTNYYNDTSYIDQSQYITNVTNVFEQAIADNPVIDLPVADTGILSGIKAIPGQIANVLADVFIPDFSLLQGYIELLLGYFSWALEPWNFFQDLINIIFVDNPDPPKIYIDFSNAESSYIYGGKAVALDMTWYARYKPYGDSIIVGFCYIWFAYWLFRNLPEIMSGVSPVPVARSVERAAAHMEEEIRRSDPEYGRVKVDAVGSITSSKGVHYSGARSAHHNIQDDQLRPKL